MSGGGGLLGQIAQVALPIAASFIPGVGPLASAALVAGTSGLVDKVRGGSWGDALKAGAMSGLGSAAAPFLGNAFASMAPETAASFGIQGGAPTIFDNLGFNSSAPGAANSNFTPDSTGMGDDAAPTSAAGGLSQGTQDFLTQMGAPEQVSSALAKADPSLAAGASGSGGGSGVGGALANAGNKALGWTASNPLPLALGAASLYSGIVNRQAQEKQQKQQQQQQQAQNSQDLANWRLTLQTPPLPRTQNPATANIDWNTYGYGPEQNFFLNNQTSPGNYLAKGGSVNNLKNKARHLAIGGAALPGLITKPIRPVVTPRSGNAMPFKAPTFSNKDPSFGVRVRRLANGGFPRKNGPIDGPGGPTDDKIKAMLSNGEYVVKAKSVSHLGNGNNDAGSDVLDIVNNGSCKKLNDLGKKIRKMKGKS